MSGINNVGGLATPLTPNTLPNDPSVGAESPVAGLTPTPPVNPTAPAGNVAPPPASAPTPTPSPLDRPQISIPSDLSGFSVGDLSELIETEVQKTSDALNNIQKVEIKESSTAEQAANHSQWQKLLLLSDPKLAAQVQSAMQSVLGAYWIEGAGSALRVAERLAPELAPLVAFGTLFTEPNPNPDTADKTDAISPNLMIAMQIMSSLVVSVATLGWGAVENMVESKNILGDEAIMAIGSHSAQIIDDAAIKQTGKVKKQEDDEMYADYLRPSTEQILSNTLENGWRAISNFAHAGEYTQAKVVDIAEGGALPMDYEASYFAQFTNDPMLQTLIHHGMENTQQVQQLLHTERSTQTHLSTIPSNA